MEKYQIFNLKNGIRGVVVRLPGLKSTTIEVFVKIGSKYEGKDEMGMSHFLEHMAFKGTKKRPLPTDINREIDAKGAMYNAGTGYEMTSYYITTVKENIPWAAEVLSDILFNATYPELEVNKERGVVIEEIKMYRDNPMMGLSSEFVKFLYGKSRIGCWNISGEVEDIKKIDRNRVINYQSKYFNPKEMVVVVCGDVNSDTENIIKEYFENYENSKSQDLPLVDISLTGKSKMEWKKDIEQAHFCLGVPAVSWMDQKKYAQKLLEIIICGNSSSRLYTKIREENALAYYVVPVSDSFKEAGFLGVQSGVKMDKLDEALEITEKELIGISKSLNDDEFNRAKEFLVGKTQLLMDRSDFVTGFVGEKVLLENRLDTIENELKRYTELKLNDLKTLAEEIIRKDKIKTVMVKQ